MTTTATKRQTNAQLAARVAELEAQVNEKQEYKSASIGNMSLQKTKKGRQYFQLNVNPDRLRELLDSGESTWTNKKGKEVFSLNIFKNKRGNMNAFPHHTKKTSESNSESNSESSASAASSIPAELQSAIELLAQFVK